MRVIVGGPGHCRSDSRSLVGPLNRFTDPLGSILSLTDGVHQIVRGGRYGLTMANDSIHDRRITAEPFDQDSAGIKTESLEPEGIQSEGHEAGLCRECHARRCQNCSNVDCTCAHPFAAVARAIVELDVSVHRTWRVLGQAGVSPKKNV
jgi:hypothetical protein